MSALEQTGRYDGRDERGVVASFGRSSIRSGGALYRLSVYENYLAICFMTAQSYACEDVGFAEEYRNGSNRMVLVLKGIPVVLYGTVESMERLSQALIKRAAR